MSQFGVNFIHVTNFSNVATGHSGTVHPKLCPEIFVIVKTKIAPPKNVFLPKTLQPGYGSVQIKNICIGGVVAGIDLA